MCICVTFMAFRSFALCSVVLRIFATRLLLGRIEIAV